MAKTPKHAGKPGQFVYLFGKKTDGNGGMKPLLGGKGANLAEMCRIGHRLGAHYLPTTCAGVDDALEAYQPELAWDDRSREIWRVVQAYPVEPLDRPFMQWVLGAALDLLPPWARTLADLGPRVPWQVQARRRALQALNWPIQRHLDQHGIAAISRRRFEA